MYICDSQIVKGLHARMVHDMCLLAGYNHFHTKPFEVQALYDVQLQREDSSPVRGP